MPPSVQESEKVLRVIERLEREVAALRRAQDEPIAVVGVSCRFPGADDPEAFWSHLVRGEETTREVPRDRWNIDALYSPDPDAVGKMSTRYGGFLERVDELDAAFFGIAPREAMLMDPQQRLLLELSWEALEHAGLSPDELYGSPSGVFVGVCASDYCRMALQRVENATAYLGTGNATSVAAGRLAYTFGFTGPCVSLDTACSSALVAVHYAGESLRKGECRVALAAAVNVILAPEVTMAFSRARMMAPDGRCKTFDERADGYVRSEGAAVVVLKTLSAARADGDRILAVIRGTAINQDGASGGLTVPNGPAQTALVKQALARARVAPSEIDYVEAHGTGTALGDPIEVGALAEVFGPGRAPERPLLLGSVKTLVGHLEIAAGMAGLLKVILALQHETIPGYPQLQQLSSRIPWQDTPFVVPREPVAWPAGERRRIAGISAFGFSGTNAHVVIEEPPPAERAAAAPQPAHVVCLSARTPDALAALAQRHADWLAEHPDAALDEIAWTANTGRARFSQRLAVVADGAAALRERLAAFARTRAAAGDVHAAVAPPLPGTLAFLFTGQGSQHAGMGKELHDLHPGFRDTIARCEAILAAHLDRPLRELLWGAHTALQSQTRYTQPVLFALEVALAALWQSWGVRPAYVMGHSVGELAAACVAGVFSLEDGLALIAARGRLMQELPEGGAMAVVLAGRDAVAPFVDRFADRLSIAGLNAPDQTVISGERGALLAACEQLQVERGIKNRGFLEVSHAFHSPLMRPMLERFRAVAEAVTYHRPSLEVISNVTGQPAGDELLTADYWVRHVLAPVDFIAGVRALDAAGVAGLLEVGPSATLIGLARACVDADRFVTAASQRPKAGGWSQLQGALATLWVHGFAADLRQAGRCAQPAPRRCVLPSYPFQRQRHWIPATDGAAPARASSGERHPLLGRRLRSPALPAGDFLFEATLSADRPAYLAHHRVYDKVVVPGAAYVELVLAGLRRELPDARASLRNLAVRAALVLAPDRDTCVQTHFADAGDRRIRFQICSAASEDAAAWQVHVTGELELLHDASEPPDAAGVPARFEHAEAVDPEALYARYAALGLGYSGAFRSIVALRRLASEPAEILARIEPPGDLAGYTLHPAMLDGCFQAVGAMVGDEASVAYLPVGIEAVQAYGSAPAAVWVHAVLRHAPAPDDPRVIADLRLFDDAGRVVCAVDGLQAVRVDRRALARATATWTDKLYTAGWTLQPADPSDGGGEPRRYLIVADHGGAGAELRALLEAHGDRCALIGEPDLDAGDPAAWSRLLAELADADATPLAGIVHLRALDEPSASLEQDLARTCGSALALVQALAATADRRLPRLWLVSRGAQAVADGEPASPSQAALWGLGRTIALEHPALGCTCVDLDAGPAPLAAELARPDGEAQLAFRAGKRYVARLQRAAQGRGQLALPDGSYRLRTQDYGSLERLALVPAARREPAPGEVELEVCASAVNFKDVLYCLGMLRAFSEQAGIERAIDQPLGFECAGRVVRLGAGVTGLALGDEVFAMAPSAMASHVTIDRRLVHRKPAHLTFAQAASIPAAFMTAIYSLEQLARLQPGDSVLIHACAGGVGQAAIQVARARGATVYGTASPAKWSHVRAQGVAHVMSSRDLAFAGELLRVTGGRGVDVVLNSLSGDHIARSADVLAQGGRFVEIGKIGIWSAAQMAAYRPDVAYFSFDLGEVQDDGALQAELLDAAVRGLEAGRLAPLPVKTFSIQRAEAGFRHLAQARNIGKVVLTLPARTPGQGAVRPDRSYWITGGLGALGLEVARSLVGSGARQLVLSSRRAPDAAVAAQLEALRAAGAEVEVAQLDVADAGQVAALVERIAQTRAPLAGIVHAAGVLDDGVLAKQSWPRFAGVLAPKAIGAWNLHLATRSLELDFFVLFSSIAGTFGAPGQANYAAANAFLDGLAALRRSAGLAATSVAWGPWAAGGMAEQTRGANRARFASFGLGRMSAGDSLQVLDQLLEAAPTALAVADVDWARYVKALPSPGAARFYARVDPRAARGEEPQAGALVARLTREPEDRRAAVLVDHLRHQIASVVGLPSADAIDAGQPLLDVGFDSLMAVELKSRLESSLGCTLSPTLLFDHPTLEQLARHLLARVLQLGGAREPAPRPDPVDAAPSAVVPLATLRERFVEARDAARLCTCSWGPDGAPLVVCVHGILDQAASWDELAVGLVARGHRVLALDLRGHGRSAHPPANAALSVLDFLLDLTAVTRELREPFVLVGHSIGASVASLYAAAHPARLARLILVEPVVPHLREDHGALELLETELRYLTEPPAHAVYPDLTTAARMLTISHPGLDAPRALRLAQRITEPCEGGLRWIWDARLRNPLGADLRLSRDQFLALLAGLEVPSTRIYGTTSQFAGTPVLVSPDAALARSRSVTIAGGHNLHTDNPAALLEQIWIGIQAAATTPGSPGEGNR